MDENEARAALQVAMDALADAPALREKIAALEAHLRRTTERLWQYHVGIDLLLAELGEDAPRIMDAVRERPLPDKGEPPPCRVILRVPMDFDAPIGELYPPRKALPTGEGYQLWRTTDWQPLSPPCATVEAVARWRSQHHDGTDADWVPYENWLWEFEWLASLPPPVRLAW